MTMAIRREVDNKQIKTWEIWNVDLGKTKGSVQGGVRPAVIVQNGLGNKYCTTVNVLPMTSSKTKKSLPIHVQIKAEDVGLYSDSTIMAEQMQTINKDQLEFKIADVPTYLIDSIRKAMSIQYSIL